MLDVTAMCLFCASICTNITERELFDSVFQQYILGDETVQYHQALDVVVEHDAMPSMTSSFVYGMMFSSTLIDGGDDEEILYALAAALLASNFWGDVKTHQRMNWRSNVCQLRSEGYFHLMYHMSFPSFTKLLNLLWKDLEVNSKKSRNCTTNQDPISPEILHRTLHYLAGGSYVDIITCAGISKPAFYDCIYKGIDAICDCLELALHMPLSIQELRIAAREFTLLSLDARPNGCVAALDGWLCHLAIPSATDTSNVVSYFSGHYQCSGLNVLATCDTKSWFTSVCSVSWKHR